MKTEEQKRKHADYMREYNRKNKDHLNKQRREVAAKLKEDDPEGYAYKRELANAASRKCHNLNRDAINARAKERNWNFNPESAKTKRQKYYEKFPARNILSNIKTRAEKKGLPFDLTEEWYNEEFKKGCAMTDIPFSPPRIRSPFSANVDKIIPSMGYVMSNCRLTCMSFNLAKAEWTDDDIITMAAALLIKHFKENKWPL